MNDPFSYEQNLSSSDLIQGHPNINWPNTVKFTTYTGHAYISQQLYKQENKHA